MSEIFVSYSRKDIQMVNRVVAHLSARKIPLWIDRSGIAGGSQWRAQIVQAVRECPAFLLVVSQNSIASDNVRKEIDLAEHYEKKIYPVFIEEVQLPPEWEYQLIGIQWVMLVGDIGQKLDELVTLLADYMSSQPVPVRGIDTDGESMAEKQEDGARDAAQSGASYTQSGGVHIGGNVSAGADFIGGDKVVHGDEVHGDKVGGDKISVGNISNSAGVAIGRGAQSYVSQGIRGDRLDPIFQPLLQAAKAQAAPDHQTRVVQIVEEMEGQAAKGKQADDNRMGELIDDLVSLAPGAVSAVVAAFADPLLAGIAGPVTNFVLKKLHRE